MKEKTPKVGERNSSKGKAEEAEKNMGAEERKRGFGARKKSRSPAEIRMVKEGQRSHLQHSVEGAPKRPGKKEREVVGVSLPPVSGGCFSAGGEGEFGRQDEDERGYKIIGGQLRRKKKKKRHPEVCWRNKSENWPIRGSKAVTYSLRLSSCDRGGRATKGRYQPIK